MEAIKKKKLSGCQYKKRRAAREEALKKQARALLNYIKKAKPATEHTHPDDVQPGTSTGENPQLEETLECASTSEFSQTEESLQCSSTSQYTQMEEEARTSDVTGAETNNQRDLEVETKNNFPPPSPHSSSQAHDLEDPGKWPKITNALRRTIIELGPVQKINPVYPKDSNRRKFSNRHYNQKMENGELVPRPWLVYSDSKDCVFCFCCKLFSTSDLKDSSTLVTTGYNRWKNISDALHTHETSLNHLKRLKVWYRFKKNLKDKANVESQNQPLYELEKKHWANVMSRVIDIIKYLCSQCLPLRRSSDDPFQNNDGNFLKLVKLFGKFDPFIASRIERTIQSESKFCYFSEDVQNEIVDLLGNAITEKICASIIEAKYFSIILNHTRDISHNEEQISVVIRFVSCEEDVVLVEEHFLGFLAVDDSSGEGFLDTILSKLSSWNLDIENIRGQGYDSGADTIGKKTGLQKFILDKSPRAFCIPCAAHSLNLVVSDAAKVNVETVSFFATVQEIFTFFSRYEKRWEVLKKHISSLTLKPDSEARWDCCIDALRTLRYQTGEIYDSLYDIFDDKEFDQDSRYQAQVFCTSLKDFKFLCSLVLWHDILRHIDPVSEMLHNADGNVSIALTDIDHLRAFFSNYHTEESYELLIETSKQLCQGLDGQPQFQAAARICHRSKASLFEQKDDSPLTPEDLFRVNFFSTVLDVVRSTLEERVEQLQQHANRFKFLYDLKTVPELDKETLRRQCVALENHLTHGNNKDISGTDLFNELCVFMDLFPSEAETLANPYEIIQYIHFNDLSLPNLKIALRILLTLPVSLPGGKRSFSRLKLIRDYLRSSIAQERLANLAMIAIENDVCDQLRMEELVSRYWSQTSEKGAFSDCSLT